MKNFLSCLFLVLALCAKAQRHELLSDNIATLQVVAGDDWLSLPVIALGGEDGIHISFDERSHVVHRYCYKIEHCEADWTVSEGLFESDYVDGFASDNVIEETEQSINTNNIYTHYSFSIPNDRCRVKMSGNYKLTVYDENEDDRPLLTACFMVVEPLGMKVRLEVSGNTDVDTNHNHQQVGMNVDFGRFTVTDPSNQIKTVVMQNGRWDNAVINSKPQYVRSDGLQWSHCRDFIFPAGNEYRKFEVLDVSRISMGLESIKWDGHQYHAWVWTDEPRPNYVYDEDANGAFYIRNSDNVENDYASEYVKVHFRLKSPRLPYDVYLNGNWTYDRFLPQYRMEWNDEAKLYEAAIPLKQGYYSYQYLMMDGDGTLQPVPSEGSFYQTENKYQAFVYYRPVGGRTDRLVGFAEVRYK